MTHHGGLRVLRGPDWDQGDTDGGEGYLGTVTQLLGNHTVRVHWDMGQDSTCRAGHDGKCDVRVFDNAQVGVRHPETHCAECGEVDIIGMLWRCQVCSGCDLCTLCYSDDKHDLRHQFVRIDAPGTEGKLLAKRKTSVKVRAIGMFPGAKVIRGKDWEWGDQDGGQGSEGEVKGYDKESRRTSVQVEWPNGVVKSYRLGLHGNVDLTCVEEEVGPFFYRDHLPLLDKTESSTLDIDEAGVAEFSQGSDVTPDDHTSKSTETWDKLSTTDKAKQPDVKSADDATETADTSQTSKTEPTKTPEDKATDDANGMTATANTSQASTQTGELYPTPGNTHTVQTSNVSKQTEAPSTVSGSTHTFQTSDVSKQTEKLPAAPRRTETMQTSQVSKQTEAPPTAHGSTETTHTSHISKHAGNVSKVPGNTETSSVLHISKQTETQPTVDTTHTSEVAKQTEGSSVRVGDKVAICVGDQKLTELQRGSGGCTARMIRCIGRTGEVTAVSAKGIVSVKFGSESKLSYRFNHQALIKIAGEFCVGDKVRVRGDGPLVRLLNTRVGWTSHMDRTLNKVGRIRNVDYDGDLHVDFNGQQYTYAPACCLPASESDVSSLDDVTSGADVQSEIKNPADQSDDPSQNLQLFRAVRNMVAEDDIPSTSNRQRYYSDHNLFGAIGLGRAGDVRNICEDDRAKIEGEVQEMTPLIYASLRGQRQCMMTLLQMGADVNRHATSDFRKTPMSAAIEGRDPSVVELLLQHGASTSYVFTFGHTAVHHAIIKDAPVALRPLAEYGADMNAKDDFGDTPLHMAIERQHHACMEVLVDLPQVDVLALNKHSMNMIHLACMMDNPTALAKVLSRDRSGVEALRKHSPALHMAAARDNVDCVRLMVMDGGADINRREEGRGLTALHVACNAAKLQTVEALLEMGAEVNLHDGDGDTPLHLAVGGFQAKDQQSEEAELELACRVQISNMLISRGAFVDARDNRGQHPFVYGTHRVREGVKTFIFNNQDIVQCQNKEVSRHSNALSSSSFSSSSSSYSSSRGGQEEGRLREALKGVGLPCGVCGAPRSDVTLQPCQHKCVCSTCSVKVTVCPLCDEEVKDKVFTGQDGQTIDPEACKQM